MAPVRRNGGSMRRAHRGVWRSVGHERWNAVRRWTEYLREAFCTRWSHVPDPIRAMCSERPCGVQSGHRYAIDAGEPEEERAARAQVERRKHTSHLLYMCARVCLFVVHCDQTVFSCQLCVCVCDCAVPVGCVHCDLCAGQSVRRFPVDAVRNDARTGGW